MPEARKHLLLVEDEAPLRQALAERLAEHGFEVEQADSGEQAIEKLAEFAFDIVVTDLRLPGLDGTRVLEAALLRYRDIVGIIVTGYGTVKDAVEAIKRGATDFVTKPFQFDELLHALNSALEQRLGNRAAVERDKALGTSRAVVMNGARDDFLAGASLAGHENRARGGRHGFEQLEQVAHGGASDDDALEPVSLLEL